MVRETIGRDVSYALTEVRTVLSRATTAINTSRAFHNDPDGAEILADLRAVVDLLEKYRKTGTTIKHPRNKHY